MSHPPPPGSIQEFVAQWLSALFDGADSQPDSGPDPAAVEQLRHVLTGLALRLQEVLSCPALRTPDARAIGAGLMAAGLGVDTLPVSLQAARAFGLADNSDPQRLDAVLDEVSAGFAEAMGERSRREHEELRSAMLDNTRNAELMAGEARFRTIFTQAAVGIGVAGLDGGVQDVNPAMLKMFGLSERLDGLRRVTDFVHPDDAPEFSKLYRELIRGERETIRMEIRFVRSDRSVLWAYLTGSLVRTEDGAPSQLVAVIEDLTERVLLRTRLEHQTYHDQLTRLPNRSHTEERLRLIFSDNSPVSRVGLCALGLDDFRSINDSLGHGVGDRVLLAVAARLQMAAGPHLISRTGGDEFSIVVQDPPGEAALRDLADRVLACLAPPLVIDAHELAISASVGIADADIEHSTPPELARAADVALSWAKAEGRGRWCVFNPERDADMANRFALMAGMPAAVNRDEFYLLYQPLVSLTDKKLTGVEALVRWDHPEFGLLGPGRFIELAERTGTIVQLGRWILSQACQQAQRWRVEFGSEAPYVSVNVAPRQLTEPSLVTDVVQVLHETGLDPGALQLEITEQALLDDASGALDALGALRKLGVRLAIDDFGTGYSSLSYLRRLPWHALKIDGTFIRGMRILDSVSPADPMDEKDEKIVQGLISIAHALGLVVTAEWVETADQAQRLVALGCDTGQGHFFGDAAAPQVIEEWLRR